MGLKVWQEWLLDLESMPEPFHGADVAGGLDVESSGVGAVMFRLRGWGYVKYFDRHRRGWGGYILTDQGRRKIEEIKRLKRES